MNAQIIERNGKPEYAVVPIDDYRVLVEKAEMLDDVTAFDSARTDLAAGEDELIPSSVAEAILAGENPVRVWRMHRGLSQTQLAERIGISQAYLAQIENGQRDGTLTVYRALAGALGVDLDDLAG
ncbi:MAG: helix-turn-helix domain-containing protein [Thiotrichales bacterium]